MGRRARAKARGLGFVLVPWEATGGFKHESDII